MRTTMVTTAIGMALAGTASAQTSLSRAQEMAAIEAITAVGGSCERIVRNQEVGQLDENTTLIAVACPGGQAEQYVLSLDQRGNMAFYATCDNLAKGTNNQMRCFS